MEPTQRLPVSSVLLRESIDFYRRHFKLLGAILLPPFALSIIWAVVSLAIDRVTYEALLASGPAAISGELKFAFGALLLLYLLILIVTSVVVNIVSQLAFVRGISDLSQGRSLGALSESYSGVSQFFFPYLWVSVLLYLVFVGEIGRASCRERV